MKLPGSLLAAFTTLALATPAMADMAPTPAPAPTAVAAPTPKLTGAARNARSAKIKRSRRNKPVAARPSIAPKVAPAATPAPAPPPVQLADPCPGCGMG